MTRVQILILAILAILVCVVFGVAAVVIRSQLLAPDSTVADQPDALPTSAVTPTWTIIPTSTFTPLPINTLPPTPTYTRVVVDTATPTASATPTITPTPANTLTPTRARRGGGSTGGPRPAPRPTSRYPLVVVEGPITYTTKNYIFVVFARVTSGDTFLPGYRMVGTHSPTGAHVESAPSCDELCKASGPKREKSLIQEGNLAFEAFFYDTGTWSLVLVDPQGRQASEVLQIDIDIRDRLWYYYHFGR